ncbi:ATP-binding protein [Streptomyces sp. NPDC054837]
MLTDLPVHEPTTEMVGRELELTSVCGRLEDSSLRLITLAGAGGVGKSRLAAEAARLLDDTFPGGIRTVDLPACPGPEEAVAAVARAVDALRRPVPAAHEPSTASGVAPAHDPTGVLEPRPRALLILDGVEHIAARLAPVVADHLAACPWLTVLATGQEVLRIYGEQVVPVAPLPPPGPLLEPDVADVQDNPAVQLFTRRAHEVNPGFALTAENVTSVVDICNLLEGVPLVLELAARRLRLFPLQEVQSWLHRGGDSHLAGLVDVPPRQRSLLAAAEWSCRGLTDGQRTLLARLALFRQGATLATAEKISPLSPAETAAAIEELLDRNLLRLDERQHTDSRLTMSRTIRVHSLSVLDGDAEEAAAARRVHTRHYQKLMHSLEGRFHGSEQQRWLRLAAAEHDNVLAALEHVAEGPDLAPRAALVTACLRPWLVRGELKPGLHWFDSTAQAMHEADGRSGNEDEAELRLRARLHTGAGLLAAALGDHDGAAHRHRRAVALYKRLRDARAGALASARMGHALFRCGDQAVGRSLLIAARTALEGQGDTVGSAEAAASLAEVMMASDHPQDALSLLERAERIQRQNGEIRDLARTLHLRAQLAWDEDDEAGAQSALRQSLTLYDSIDERTELAAALDTFALLVQRGAGQPQRATRLLAAAENLRRRTGVKVDSERWDRLQGAVTELRSQLGWSVFATAWVEGLRLRPETMVGEALAVVEPGQGAERGEAAALTPRQLQVALLVAEGMTNRQIASRLKIAEWTVVNHVRNVMRKLGCRSRVQVAWAVGRRR